MSMMNRHQTDPSVITHDENLRLLTSGVLLLHDNARQTPFFAILTQNGMLKHFNLMNYTCVLCHPCMHILCESFTFISIQ